MKRIIFEFDPTVWVFPFAIKLQLVGNNHRPWNIIISFLCIHLVICIDEDCYKIEDGNDD